ncbi:MULTISPECIES: transcriptional repressor [unclassified Mesorhizobium]|uniref:Fur family transcriptional regulator n=1 Tax=unclassified Mesorhizobium TaxID=325217 RepID=UPI00112DF90D|nr:MULTISPECIES: transcriptional repressor [unclassified Mesorhizobium]TPI15591.1 transcriptional repressor [Mesorhizobium sp. B4-1-1]TPL40774.1 transcriptional repressor [Mesorhizobium sp. B2-4-6]
MLDPLSAGQTFSGLTKNQALVLETIAKARKPIGAYEILRKLKPYGIKSPVQIYRAVNSLIQCGIVHKVESINAFVRCTDVHLHRGQTTILAICDGCGTVVEHHDGTVDRLLEAWARQEALQVEAVAIELKVRCASCSASSSADEH